jgi:hypothetical protein
MSNLRLFPALVEAEPAHFLAPLAFNRMKAAWTPIRILSLATGAQARLWD